MTFPRKVVLAGVLAALSPPVSVSGAAPAARARKEQRTAGSSSADRDARRAPPAPDAGASAASGIYRPARPAFRWEFPTVLSEVDVPEVLETNGIQSRFKALVLALPFEQAYLHFRESFLRQGLYVAPPREQLELAPGQVSLTGLDPEADVTYTIIFTLYDDGTTGAIVGEAYFKGRELSAQNPFVPVMAGGEGLVTQRLEAGRSVAYRVRARQPEVMTFYGQVLRDRGYAQQADGTFTRGSSAVRIVVEPSEGAEGTVDVGIVEFATPAAEP